METDVQLRQQLKQLKLSGVLESLEHRILECRQNGIDYLGFLSLLLQDEIELRFARKVQRLIAQATFGTEQTFEGFDLSLSTGLDRTLLRELSTCAFIGRAVGILLDLTNSRMKGFYDLWLLVQHFHFEGELCSPPAMGGTALLGGAR